MKHIGHKDFDSSNFVLFLFAWRIPILIVTGLAFVASIIFSSPAFITPKYKSTVIMYPTSTSSVSKALLSDTYGGKEDILEFGEDEQTEQMLQILNSNRIRDRIVNKYSLFDHYEIEPASKYRYTRLFREYESNINFRRTEYNAVKITVLDKDPVVAANIANDIADLMDSIKIEMQKERAIRGFKIVEAEYLQRQQEIQMMEDSLTKLRELGVHDYESQSEMINQQLAIEIANNNTAGVRALRTQLEVLAKYGGPYVSLRDALEHEKKQFSVLKTKYEEAKVDAEEELPQKFVVSTAYQAEKKSYPIRWLIVVVSTIAALLIVILAIIVLENIAKSDFISNRINERSSPEDSDDEPQPVKVKKKRLINFHLDYNKERKAKKVIIEKVEKEEVNEWVSDLNDNIKKKMENFFSNIKLLRLLLKWKWHLVVIVLIAGLLAAIFSGPRFITPKYKSVGIVYPSNIAPYSEESETEQMVQWFNSQDIKDSVIARFNLAEHYKVDPSYKYYYSTLMYKYGKHISIAKTMYESIEIEVMDKDPVLARDMVNAIIYYCNLKIRSIHEEKYGEVEKATGWLLDKKRNQIDSVKSVLYDLGNNYEIIDYGHQSWEVTRGYLRTVDGDNAARNINSAAVAKLKENLEEYGPEFIENNTRLYELIKLYTTFEELHDLATFDANKKYSYTNMVTEPVVADKKSYPIRWLIVMYSIVATLVFALIAIIFIEKKQQISIEIAGNQ